MDAEAGGILTVDLGGARRELARAARARAAAPNAPAVVKADAYGTAIETAAPRAGAAGCRTFFVALPAARAQRVRAAAAASDHLRPERPAAGRRRLCCAARPAPRARLADEIADWAALRGAQGGGGPPPSMSTPA